MDIRKYYENLNYSNCELNREAKDFFLSSDIYGECTYVACKRNQLLLPLIIKDLYESHNANVKYIDNIDDLEKLCLLEKEDYVENTLMNRPLCNTNILIVNAISFGDEDMQRLKEINKDELLSFMNIHLFARPDQDLCSLALNVIVQGIYEDSIMTRINKEEKRVPLLFECFENKICTFTIIRRDGYDYSNEHKFKTFDINMISRK